MSRRGSGAAGRQASSFRALALRCAIAAFQPRCPAVPLCALAIIGPIFPTSASAQTDLEESKRRLEEIRAERDRLEQQQRRLQGQVHDVNDELSNLERQRESTHRIVNEIERQIGGLASQLDRSSAELILAQDNLAERRAVLERRLVDIYKRGPLHTFQVLLAAEGFGDLLSRYKYLYLTSQQDRSLVADVEKLRNRVVTQRNNILNVRSELDRRRDEREAEFSKYSELASERSRRLQTLQRSARSTERRLTELQKDESRLNGLLASLERARREGRCTEEESLCLAQLVVEGFCVLRPPVCDRAHLEQLDELVRTRRALGARHPVQLGEVEDVLAGGEVLIDARGVRQHTHRPARADRIGRHADAVDARIARVRTQHGVEHAQRRRLACAVRPEEAGDAPVERAQAHAAHGRHLAEALHETVGFDHLPAFTGRGPRAR